MRVKYNRVSTVQQTGKRFEADRERYDLTLMDRVSGTVKFRERPKGAELVKLVEEGKVTEVIFEEFSRCGRNTGDIINTLEWLDQHNVNVSVRNLGIQSRPSGKKNPIWKLICSTMASLYEMELENIKERTHTGRLVFVQNGGKLGRPEGTNESTRDFLKKEKSQEILRLLGRRLRYSEISKILNVSPKTIKKVKLLAQVN